MEPHFEFGPAWGLGLTGWGLGAVAWGLGLRAEEVFGETFLKVKGGGRGLGAGAKADEVFGETFLKVKGETFCAGFSD